MRTSREMRRFLLIALVLVACHHRHAGSPTTPCGPIMGALGDVILNGRVLMADGQPAANARVRFLLDNSIATYYGRADAGGVFRVLDMWHGNYTYTVTLANEQQPYMSGRATFQCGENSVEITLATAPCVFIAGKVRDPSGYFGVRDATVSLPGRSTRSDADGVYALNVGCPPADAGLPAELTVRHAEYQTQTVPLTIPSSSMTIDFRMVAR